MDNCSANECNLSYLDEEQVSPTSYIVISVAHMLVVIVPTISLGAIILYRVRADKQMRDPITILFCAVTISSMLSPSVYGLLRDISTITDLPLLGSCLSVSRVVYTSIAYFLQISTPSQIALITCTQYVVINYGKNRITTRRALTAFGVVTAMAAFAAILIIATGLGAYGGAVPKIRGSWCKENGAVLRNYAFQSAALAVASVVCPATLIVVSSVRSYLIVKRSMMEEDKIVRSVLLVCAASLILGFAFVLPTTTAYGISVAHNSDTALYFTSSMTDTKYCFVLLLLMTTHRGIRNAIFSNVIKHFSNRNKVAPVP